MQSNKISILDIQQAKENGRPLSMITAYDYSSASLVDEAGVDMILIGDSLGMVMLGYPNTAVVTMEEMLHHSKAVARGASRALLISDMPFMSYQTDVTEAVRNAGRFIKEAQVDAVKLEGGREMAITIEAINRAGIPVMGHVGLTPQSATKLGGFLVQGRTASAAEKLLDDALALQEAGCFAIVLEAVPARIADVITERLQIPTIGIGASVNCDGQVLVYHDMLGISERHVPRFVKPYAAVAETIKTAVAAYIDDVKNRRFPTDDHTYKIKREELDQFLNAIGVVVEE